MQHFLWRRLAVPGLEAMKAQVRVELLPTLRKSADVASATHRDTVASAEPVACSTSAWSQRAQSIAMAMAVAVWIATLRGTTRPAGNASDAQ